jgi:hypothetical protein
MRGRPDLFAFTPSPALLYKHLCLASQHTDLSLPLHSSRVKIKNVILCDCDVRGASLNLTLFVNFQILSIFCKTLHYRQLVDNFGSWAY